MVNDSALYFQVYMMADNIVSLLDYDALLSRLLNFTE